MRFIDALPLINDLDIILFKGTDVVSVAITDMERLVLGQGRYSHCGLVISKKHLTTLNIAMAASRSSKADSVIKKATPDEVPVPDAKVNVSDPDDELYIWESTMSSDNSAIDATVAINVETGLPFFGVQIRNLTSVIEGSLKNGIGVSWSKLLFNPLLQSTGESESEFKDRVRKVETQLNELHKEYYLRPYPLNIFRLMRGLCGCLKCVKPLDDKGAVFCSQFVAIVYQTLGILDKGHVAGEVVPEDFANYRVSAEGMKQILHDPVPLAL
jgi:hypothetical protein